MGVSAPIRALLEWTSIDFRKGIRGMDATLTQCGGHVMIRRAWFDHRGGESRGLAAIGPLLAATAFVSCAADRADVPEAVGEVSQAVVGPYCSQNSATQQNCWTYYSGPNYAAFDVSQGFTCAAWSNSQEVDCLTPSSTSALQTLPLGWAQPCPNCGRAPAAVKSVAVSRPDYDTYGPYVNRTGVALLLADNTVWTTIGDAAAPFFSFTGGSPNFGILTKWMDPFDNNGKPVCLSKIVAVNMPYGIAGPRTDTIGLSCPSSLNPNQIYIPNLQGGKRVWFMAQSSGIAPWSSLWWDDWVDISHSEDREGQSWKSPAYLLNASGTVVRIGTGVVGNNGQVNFDPPMMLPTLSVPGFPLAQPVAVGGPFVITNAGGSCPALNAPCTGDDYRFYRFDGGTNTWQVTNSGTPWEPGNCPPPPETCDLQDGLPYDRIVDGSSFLGNGSAFGVHHNFGRYYLWTGSPTMYHGWSSPVPGCSTASANATAATADGGSYPYNIGDSPACQAWKLAATICNTQPVGYGFPTPGDWTCPSSGGFIDPAFGAFCSVGNQYACSDCYGACNANCPYPSYTPLSLRNCSGSETSEL
jgi:hypothetical protein